MTKINLLIPLFQTVLVTNNSTVVSQIIMSKYGFTPSEIFWIGSNNKEGSENFECVVRVENITINFDQILEILERSDKIGQTLKRIQTDIFNVVKIYDELANDKRSVGGINIEKGKYYGMNEVEDSQVSLKIDSKNYSMKEKDSEHSQYQLLNSISELTRQNIKLKDALIYYEIQFDQLVKVNNDQSGDRRKSNDIK